MDNKKYSQLLQQYLRESLDLQVWDFNEKDERLFIINKEDSTLGFSLSLPAVLSKLKAGKEKEKIQETANKVIEMTRASLQKRTIKGQEDQIFPVLRSKSHPIEQQGHLFLSREHTAESTVFYALDFGKSYTLIDEEMMKETDYTEEDIQRFAMQNLKKLDTSFKEDVVAGNTFYFFGQSDGYAASRVLNDELLSFMERKMEKEMGVAIPHQDVLIVADIQNETGYKILSRLNIDFCMKGDIPISPLPFIWTEDGKLDPIMIMENPGASPKVKRK